MVTQVSSINNKINITVTNIFVFINQFISNLIFSSIEKNIKMFERNSTYDIIIIFNWMKSSFFRFSQIRMYNANNTTKRCNITEKQNWLIGFCYVFQFK